MGNSWWLLLGIALHNFSDIQSLQSTTINVRLTHIIYGYAFILTFKFKEEIHILYLNCLRKRKLYGVCR